MVGWKQPGGPKERWAVLHVADPGLLAWGAVGDTQKVKIIKFFRGMDIQMLKLHW